MKHENSIHICTNGEVVHTQGLLPGSVRSPGQQDQQWVKGGQNFDSYTARIKAAG